jgi:hypothetical protein
MSSQIRFFVYENGDLFPISSMTEPETAAIQECVQDLLPSAFSMGDVWMDVDTCLYDDEDADQDEDDYKEPEYGLLKCRTLNLKPKNGSLGEMSIAGTIPDEILRIVNGKRFTVHPRQLGLSPWGQKVEIQFETLSSAPAAAVSSQATVNVEDDEDAVIDERAYALLSMIGQMSIQERLASEQPKPKTSGVSASSLIQRALAVQGQGSR